VVHCARTASFFMRNKTKSSKSQEAAAAEVMRTLHDKYDFGDGGISLKKAEAAEAAEAAETESAERAAAAAEAAILRSNFTFDKLIETFDSGLTDDLPTLTNEDWQCDFYEVLETMCDAYQKCPERACELAANDGSATCTDDDCAGDV